MPPTAYSRKAGSSGPCAIVAGTGDGSVVRRAARDYIRVIALCLPGETVIHDFPKNVFQFVIASIHDASFIVSKAFGYMGHTAELEATDFYHSHPIAIDESVRVNFCRLFYGVLSERPLTMGDDVIDGMQGAYHAALQAHMLVRAPTPDELAPMTCPAICIGSGPSLADHLDELRALQGKALIICADSALEGLLKAGITPHMVTPLERVWTTLAMFPRKHYPGVVFAGASAVHQDVAAKFDKHLSIPGSDVLFTWQGYRQDQLFFYGQSTGVASVALAAKLTSGAIYLVGHDLAFRDNVSHWDGYHQAYQLGSGVERLTIEGHDGKEVQTQRLWITFRDEISDTARATGRVANVNAVTGVGAAITGTLALGLPDPATLPDFALPAWPEPNDARADAFADVLERLPRDARAVLAGLSRERLTISDIDFSSLCPSRNAQMFGYVFRSIIGQFSMQSMTGQDPTEGAQQCAQAICNAMRGILPLIDEMGTAPLVRERELVGAP